MNYNEIGKAIFGDNCPSEWGRDRPWKVERYEKPATKTCHHKITTLRIITKSGYRINLTERLLGLVVKIVNEAE